MWLHGSALLVVNGLPQGVRQPIRYRWTSAHSIELADAIEVGPSAIDGTGR